MLSQLKSRLGLGPFSFWGMFQASKEQLLTLKRSGSLQILAPKNTSPQLKRVNSMDSMKKSTYKKSKPKSKRPEIESISGQELQTFQNKNTPIEDCLSIKAEDGDSNCGQLIPTENFEILTTPNKENLQTCQEHIDQVEETGMITPPRKPRTMEVEQELLKPPRKCQNRSSSSNSSKICPESPLFESSLLLEQTNFPSNQQSDHIKSAPLNSSNHDFKYTAQHFLQLFSEDASSIPVSADKSIQTKGYDKSNQLSTIQKSIPTLMQKSNQPKPKCNFTRVCAICGEDATLEYIIQACSHRLHTKCRKHMVIRNNYKCPICQRKKPKKYW